MKNYERKLAIRGKTRSTFVGGLVDKSDWKQGDVRADGLVFMSKRKKPDGRFQEWWVTREQFEAKKKAQRDRMRWRYHNDPEYREKERQQNTSERQRAAKRRWNKANKVHMENYMAKRRAKVRGHVAELTPEQNKIVLEFYKFRDILNHVHGCVMFEVDHIKPISRGGLHHPDNLRVTTAKFNHVKFVNQLCPVTLQKTGTY